MMNRELYEAIFHRKSVRRYEPAELPESTIEEIIRFAGEAKPLDADINYEFLCIKPNHVRNLAPVRAPHYLCLYSEKKTGYLMNAGFLLQQLDLYLSSREFGSCWLGMGRPVRINPPDGMEYVIMLAFGKPAEPVHRSDLSEFKRNNISEISGAPEVNVLLEPVRLAPSASNSQPWLFSGSAGEITVCRRKFNPIKAAVYGGFNQIDIGIALCHLWLSALHLGKKISFVFGKESAPRGAEYMAKVRIES
jgi:nitroreductase